RAGKQFAHWPISSGRPGDDTPNGSYLTIEKSNPAEMKGPGYDIRVPFSVRITWNGDYLHAAPWSVGSQGFANVSHGCVNMSPAARAPLGAPTRTTGQCPEARSAAILIAAPLIQPACDAGARGHAVGQAHSSQRTARRGTIQL